MMELTPAEVQAIRNRHARMSPRLDPPSGPLAELRRLSYAQVVEISQSGAPNAYLANLELAARDVRIKVERRTAYALERTAL